MEKMKIPFNKPFIVGKELYNISLAVIQNTHMSGNGPFGKSCQKWLEERLGCPKALLTHSCTAALEMSAILAGIGPGDEVIMPSFTFVSTANAFALRGGIPVFVDIRPDTLNLDENLIESALSKNTKAVVPVHYAGLACEMEPIMEIAGQLNLIVIEDAAQGLFSTHKEQYLGTIGHLGCLSFHETKNIISGEGGALLINDVEFIQRAEIIWEKGTDRSRFHRGEVDKYTWVDVGSSYLPSELVSAFLYSQMEEAERITKRRYEIFEKYFKLLSPLQEKGHARLPALNPRFIHNGHIFYLITGSEKERRKLISHLKDRGILAVFHFIPLHSSPAGKKFGLTRGTMKNTEDLSERLLRLPLFFEMTDEEIEYVAEAVLEFYQ